MAPNLFVVAQTLVTPRRWRKRSRHYHSFRTREHWDSPVPGTYSYVPDQGWFLVELDSPNETEYQLPRPVRYSRVLKRYLFQDEYITRKKFAQAKDTSGNTREVGFFQLDNKVAWVNCWDGEGVFIPGPYKLWCIDKETGQFRDMLKRDDPERQSRPDSSQNSINASQGTTTSSTSTRPQRSGAVSNGSSRRSSVQGRIPSMAPVLDLSTFNFSPSSSQPSTRQNSIRHYSECESCDTALTSPCVSRPGTLSDLGSK